MQRIEELLEQYYETRKPLGVAFAQDDTVLFGLGRPCTFALSSVSSREGLSEIDLESWDAVVFASSYRWGKRLIAQFPRGVDATQGPPGSFVRLAAAVQQALDQPRDTSGGAPSSPTPVQPRPPRTRPPMTAAKDEDD